MADYLNWFSRSGRKRSDQELIEALRTGDEQVWKAAYDEFRNRVIRTVRSQVTASEDEARLAYQNAWVYVMERIRNENISDKKKLDFSGQEASFRTFLTTVAINKCKEIRRSPPYVMMSDDDWLLERLAWLLDDESNGFGTLFKSLSEPCLQLIAAAIDRLGSTLCANIFRMRFWEGLTLEKVAAQLGSNPKNIRNQSSACNHKLMAKLKEMGFDEHCG